MAITINSTQKPEGKSYQNIFITVNADGDDCKFTHSAPSDLSGDDLQAYVDGREDFYKRELLRNMYVGADAYDSSLEDFEAWVSAGAKNAEVSKEIPAVEAQDAVYEDVEVEPAIEAENEIPAVMGERQKVVVSEVDEEVTSTDVVKEGGKYVQKTTTKTVKKEVKEPQSEEVPLYNEDGDEIGKHNIPVMESYEVEPAVPAVEAVDAVIEKRLVSEAVTAVAKKTLVIQPEVTIEKKAWVDSH